MRFVHNDGGRAAAGFKGRAGDCVTRAIAIAAERPYREVYDRLAEGQGTQKRSPSKRAKSNHRHGQRTALHGVSVKRKWFREYMAELGFVWHPTMQIGSGCKVHLKAEELPGGRLIVSLSRHYCAVIDGVIHDNHDPRRSDSYRNEPDHGQELKPNQSRNQNGVWTTVGGRCVYGYWRKV